MSAIPSARILVVDGDPAAREQLARVLTAEGFAVSLAPDGRAALDLVLAQPFDLVLADAALLRTGGPQFHALVRSLGFGGAVVWMRSDRRAAAHTGHPTQIVRKPVDRPALLAAIHRALARRVSGIWSDPATGEGGTFAGTLTVAGVERRETELNAVGAIDGHAGAFGRVTDTFRAPVTEVQVAAVAAADQDKARPVLYLERRTIRLELLRLVVELPDPIAIDLGADPGLYPGILLDAVATLRDRGAPLGNLAYLLNQIVAKQFG